MWDKLIWSHKLGHTIQCISKFTVAEVHLEVVPITAPKNMVTTKEFTDSGLKPQHCTSHMT